MPVIGRQKSWNHFESHEASAGVRHGDVHEREKTRQLHDIEKFLVGNLNSDLIVKSRRSAKARRSVVSPEDADEGLFRRARGTCVHVIAAERFHFVVGRGVLRAVESGWGTKDGIDLLSLERTARLYPNVRRARAG